jgi:hypothetical protein
VRLYLRDMQTASDQGFRVESVAIPGKMKSSLLYVRGG